MTYEQYRRLRHEADKSAIGGCDACSFEEDGIVLCEQHDVVYVLNRR